MWRAPPRGAEHINCTSKWGGFLKHSLKTSKIDGVWGPRYLSFQELGKSWCYRLASLEVSVGADSWQKAGPAAHSGRIGSGPLLHRSPCTAEEGEEEGVRTHSGMVSCEGPCCQRTSMLYDITRVPVDERNHPEPGTCAYRLRSLLTCGSHLAWLEGLRLMLAHPGVCLSPLSDSERRELPEIQKLP